MGFTKEWFLGAAPWFWTDESQVGSWLSGPYASGSLTEIPMMQSTDHGFCADRSEHRWFDWA